MKLLQGLSQKFAVEMRVNFRGCNAFMTQHFLHGPQVRTSFDQVSGKGMTEGMG